jgi:hypothetical protein
MSEMSCLILRPRLFKFKRALPDMEKLNAVHDATSFLPALEHFEQVHGGVQKVRCHLDTGTLCLDFYAHLLRHGSDNKKLIFSRPQNRERLHNPIGELSGTY